MHIRAHALNWLTGWMEVVSVSLSNSFVRWVSSKYDARLGWQRPGYLTACDTQAGFSPLFARIMQCCLTALMDKFSGEQNLPMDL